MVKSLASRACFSVSVEQEEEKGSGTFLKISKELHVTFDYARCPRETRCFHCYECKKIDGMESLLHWYLVSSEKHQEMKDAPPQNPEVQSVEA